MLYATGSGGVSRRTSPCETVVPAAGDHMSDAFGDDKAATLYDHTTLGTYPRSMLEKECTLN